MPGGARRHLPRPAAPATLAPPREAAPPSMRGLWPQGYKGAAVRASARVGRQLTGRRPPSAGPLARPLQCSATAGGRARRTSGQPRDAGRTGTPSRILGLPPGLMTLSVPSDLGGRPGHVGGATIQGQPPLTSRSAACGTVRARPWEPTPGQPCRGRGETALKLSPRHARQGDRAEVWLASSCPAPKCSLPSGRG